MSHVSKEEYLESCRRRYPSRNRLGRSAMIDEVSDTLGWDRKHTIKALNGKVSRGGSAKRRVSKRPYGEEESAVITAIWKASEQPCSVRLKETLPLWLESYESRHGKVEVPMRTRILGYSVRTLDRITKPHRGTTETERKGRSAGLERIEKRMPFAMQGFDCDNGSES